jgi:hypothetical protein
MAAATKTIQCTADTYCDYLYPGTNFSSASGLKAYGNRLTYNKYAILQFAIPDIIKYAKISSASLSYFLKESSNVSYTGVAIKGVYKPILANGIICDTVTYNNLTNLAPVGEFYYPNTSMYPSGSWGIYTDDISSIFANNMKNGYFSLLLEIECPVGMQEYDIGSFESGNSASITVTYEETEPVIPTIISPNGTYNNLNQETKFSWRYNSATGAQQASATIEWKTKAASSYSTVVVSGTDTSYTFPSNTFLQGIVEWRVKTTDTAGLTSPYANATFTAIGQPAIPVITNIENKAITTITWNASGQAAYRVKIMKDGKEIISDEVSSPNTYYKPNAFLENGTYSVELSIMNAYNLWSNTTSKSFVINVAAPSKPSITAYPMNSEVEIIATYTGKAILYRAEAEEAFIPIAKLSDTRYTDRNVVSGVQYRYYIRCYDLGFADSKTEDIKISYKGFYLQNSLGMVHITQSEDKFLPFSEELGKEKTLVNYVGREYPVMEIGEHKNLSISRKCLLTIKAYDMLKKIFYSNLPVLYRDTFGNKMFCDISLGKSTRTMLDTYYSVDLTITKIDESEEINIYD